MSVFPKKLLKIYHFAPPPGPKKWFTGGQGGELWGGVKIWGGKRHL